jgi:hypothetical protein
VGTGGAADTQRWPKLARYVAAVHERPTFRKLIDEETPQFGRSAA